ncbi:MAG TPA: hypothetical protein VJU13_01350 [Candidatus Nitrosocosmicus sp.]|nr:hypothetical protein [Candidatus Nitrosocosmicus sp.]
MDIDEFQDRSLEIGIGLMRLTGDLYGATVDEVSLEELNKLRERTAIKIKQYESLLCDESSEVRKQGLKDEYSSYIERIHKYTKQLMEKYPDSK